MSQRKPCGASSRRCIRFRVGRVSVYYHHTAWWLYYRENGDPVRKRAAETREEAEQAAAEINAQLTTSAPTRFAFAPIDVAALQKRFLVHHEDVLRSSVATIRRYRTATQHLVDFAGIVPSHQVSATAFTALLRKRQISPNGHAHAAKRSWPDSCGHRRRTIVPEQYEARRGQRRAGPFVWSELRQHVAGGRIGPADLIRLHRSGHWVLLGKGWERPTPWDQDG